MNKIYYNPSFPEILEISYILDNDIQNRMIDTVLLQKDTANYHGGYTFQVTDQHDDFKKLYDYFFNLANNIFGPLNIALVNKDWCWANVYNCNNFKTNLHNHVKTSSINAIYYLKIPKNIVDSEGGLVLLHNKTQELQTFIPNAGDLLIMPNYIYHEPQPHSSLDYRISINMEICTTNPVTMYYTTDKIYAKANFKL
jgi:hypothetical protein